jgi:hypothetical protein
LDHLASFRLSSPRLASPDVVAAPDPTGTLFPE